VERERGVSGADDAGTARRPSRLRAFTGWNRHASRALGMPHVLDFHTEYERLARAALRTTAPRVVVDVGGGRRCPYADARLPGTRIVAVDVSAEELRGNVDADEVRVADATDRLPFDDAAADLITSRSVLEHLPDLGAFFAEAARVLRPGGEMIHTFPCRFAPFALLNRALPRAVSRRALDAFLPDDAAGFHGFPAVYDRCYPSAVERLLAAAGFAVGELRVSYYQSEYFAFFVPAYLVSCAYELSVRALGARDLCAYMLLRARKLAV
jgi:SAM-dependent methyltransferase